MSTTDEDQSAYSSGLCARTTQDDSWALPYHTQSITGLYFNSKWYHDQRQQFVFASHNDGSHCEHVQHGGYLAKSCNDSSFTVSPAFNSGTATPDSQLDSSLHAKRATDDSGIQNSPSQNVDYLSHNWEEEDIWSSLKHIVSKRKAYDESARLENALWRTWTISRYRLKTEFPETLNWWKDCDVTWLYGPIQTSPDKLAVPTPSLSRRGTSKLCDFANRRPILKKRSLLYPLYFKPLCRNDIPELSAEFPLEVPASAKREKRSIHFSQNVEQFMSVEDGVDDDDESDGYRTTDNDDSSSDEGLMMKGPSKPSIRRRSTYTRSLNKLNAASKSIVRLPSKSLKPQEDIQGLAEPGLIQCSGSWSSTLPLSMFREPLPPLSQLSSKLLLGRDNEGSDMSWKTLDVRANRKPIVPIRHDISQQNTSLRRHGADDYCTLHHIAPEMFPLYDEPVDDIRVGGFVDWMLDTVNTAKDIAYVIWTGGRTT